MVAAGIAMIVKGQYIFGPTLLLLSIPMLFSVWKGYLKDNFINVPPRKICAIASEKDSSQEKGN
jgi:hypothetical protein